MIWASIIVFLVSTICFNGLEPLMAAPSQPEKALILYESETRPGMDFPVTVALAECLGHFGLHIDEISVNRWQPGLLSGYNIVFYIGINNSSLPEGLLAEMDKIPRLVWVEQNIEQYARFKGWSDFKSEGEQWQFASLLYNGRRLSYPADIPVYIAYPESGAIVYAYADNLDKPVPYIWQKENVWYIGRIDFYGSAFLILADVLHDICGEEHPASRKVHIRVEDVNPTTSPENMAALIDALSELGIPYSVGVIPAYVNKGKIITLNDVPELVEVLKRVEETGGSIIQHGYTHQNEFSPLTGEGFEFWNARDDTPMPGNEEEFVSSRVNSGLEVLAQAGLYPVAFEAPHFAMSHRGYRALSRQYSMLAGQIQVSDISYNLSLLVPYIISSQRTGMMVFSGDLGYYDTEEVDPFGSILAAAESYTVVRDCQIGFYYHNYLPPGPLVEIVKGLRELGFQFDDYRNYDYRIDGQSVKIVNVKGNRQVITDIEPVSPENEKGLGLLRLFFNKWVSALSVLLVFIVLSFVIIILTVRRNKKRLYETG
ncbi:MAG: DUF2334 domain-containing protein [Bacillota bacterium]